MNHHTVKDFVITHQLLIFFSVVLLVSWAFWIPMALDKKGILGFPLPIIIGSTIGAFSPLLTVYLLDKLSQGEISVEAIFSDMKPRKNQVVWLLLAAFLIPFSYGAGNILSFLSGQERKLVIVDPQIVQELGGWLVIIIPLTFFAGVLSSPLGEEPGWRGFAVSRLQLKFGLHGGSFILGSFWWIWHQPINIANGMDITFYSYVSMVLASFLYDSLYNLSKENILTAMFAHSSSFVTFTYIYSPDPNWWSSIFLLASVVMVRTVEHQRRKDEIDISF